jgi:hypothetical protein
VSQYDPLAKLWRAVSGKSNKLPMAK